MILNHVGTPLGLGSYEGTRGERFGTWRDNIRTDEALAKKWFAKHGMNELVNDALQMVRPMVRIKDLQLTQTAGEPPRVDADPFAIRQLLLNLLLNALDFASTRITIGTSRTADGSAEVVVADDGPGVPPENRERIFRRFVTTRPGGNGLGLATSRDIAQAHGGTLALREGEGATFVLTLPPA